MKSLYYTQINILNFVILDEQVLQLQSPDEISQISGFWIQNQSNYRLISSNFQKYLYLIIYGVIVIIKNIYNTNIHHFSSS